MLTLRQIDRNIAAMGARFDPIVLRDTRALYQPLVEAQPWMDRTVTSDIAYGDHERHRLDIYPPDTDSAPVLLFVHGGGFVAGDKSGDPVFYGNVGRYFAAAGFCTVTMNYRLAPAYGWPSGAADVAAAIDWIVHNIRHHRGDPDRILLLGHSAGASHSATCLLDPRVDTPHRSRIIRAALIGGFYAAQSPLQSGPAAYFGTDESLLQERSPASHADNSHPPLLLAVAQFDPAPIADQSYILARTLNRADGMPPRLIWLEAHNHVSSMYGLGLGTDDVGRTLREFFAPTSTLRVE